MKSRFFRILLAFALSIPGFMAQAQVPAQITYQGRLVQGTNLYNGIASLTFRFFAAATGGSAFFQSTNAATVVDGLYATQIGRYVNLGNLDSALDNPSVWLEVVVNGTTLAPREWVLAVPYARRTHGLLATTNFSIVLNPVDGANVMSPLANYSAIGGGQHNAIRTNANYATIGGGRQNTNQYGASCATIGGGQQNAIRTNAEHATIGGGGFNIIYPNATYTTIGGGYQNYIDIDADYATIGGGNQNHIRENADTSTIGGGGGNVIQTNNDYATIAGGQAHVIQINTDHATIGGGLKNTIGPNAPAATIGGGTTNTIQTNAQNAVIGGGSLNTIQTNAQHAVIGGGELNAVQTNAKHAVIAGGYNNVIQPGGMYATIPGGANNSATNYAFAAGQRAKANHKGAFVWGDAVGADIVSTTNNSVTMRAYGGYRLITGTGPLGAQLQPNATTWSALSDRNAKENFAPIDVAEILNKVETLPLTAWNYKADPNRRRYIGPVAQDFHAAFGLGDDTSINTLDTDGVVLAAIQALAKENKELRRRIERLEQANGQEPAP